MLLNWLRHQAQDFSREETPLNESPERIVLSFLKSEEPRSLGEILDHVKSEGITDIGYPKLKRILEKLAESNEIRTGWTNKSGHVHRTYYRNNLNANPIATGNEADRS
jgi:DNA-binding PadR family transcriptional regulator